MVVTRGSLRSMVELMVDMFDKTKARRLAIYQVRCGKYYNLTDVDLLWPILAENAGSGDISFLCLTKREVLSMFKSDQLNMFGNQSDG